jgi:protoporphyrinogen/coproporphyrinogen III oxidase
MRERSRRRHPDLPVASILTVWVTSHPSRMHPSPTPIQREFASLFPEKNQILDVAIIGGGISGLTAAWHISSRFPSRSYALYEASQEWGGVLQTESVPPYRCESSADSFLVTPSLPYVAELARELGMESELVRIKSQAQQAFVVRGGKLHPVPSGLYLMVPRSPWSLWGSKLLSWPGKMRLAFERFIPPRISTQDESLQEFACRRVGEEAFRWIAQPLISGIYAADPERLSISAALPQLVELERKYGSLTRGLGKSPELAAERSSGARYDKFMSFQGGVGSLVETLAKKLPAPSLQLNTEVKQIERNSEQIWSCRLGTSEIVRCRSLIVAVPAFRAAEILRAATPQLAGELDQIHFGSIAVVQLAFKRSAMVRDFTGVGIVVPQLEGRPILAISFTSAKFDGRCPSDEVLVRVFFGGSQASEMLMHDDRLLVEVAWQELRALCPIEGAPLFSRVNRWMNSTPQYFVGHVERMERIQSLLKGLPGLFLCGNSYQGIGIPQCVRSGRAGGDAAAAYLLRTQNGPRASG